MTSTAAPLHLSLPSLALLTRLAPRSTFEKATDVFGTYIQQRGKDPDAKQTILDFLGWDEGNDNEFAQDVRIVLAAAEFNIEITSSVLWLIEHGIDIRCVRLKPYNMDGRVLVDVQRIIPPPEAAHYQVQIREKREREQQARTSNIDFTRYDIRIEGKEHAFQWKRNESISATEGAIRIKSHLFSIGAPIAFGLRLTLRSTHQLSKSWLPNVHH